MKKLLYLLFTSLTLVSLSGCEKGQEQMTDDNFHPRIIDNNAVFMAASRIINQGQSAVYNGLTFSPKPGEKSKISWKVNGTEVSTDTTYTFTPTTGGEFEIKLEATYNNQTSTRISKVLVSPTTYTRKAHTNVALGYLSDAGKAANADWSKLTHVAFQGARVISSTSVDFSKANLNQNGDEIVARGHIAGVPVLLGVAGRLSGVDGWSLYNSTDFGNAINSPTKRASLIALLKDYIILHKYDGVDVMMTDVGNDDYALTTSFLAGMGPFVTELKAALPANSIVTATVTTSWVHWEYGNMMAADWINVHAFDNGYNVGPGAARGQQSPTWFMNDAANLWNVTKGYPKNKIVLGLPAFALRYNAIDGAGNNLSWGSYDYIPYKTLVGLDATAPTKDHSAAVAFGAYYNGTATIAEKANIIKTNGYRGAYIWAIDYDVAPGTNSIVTTVGNILK